MSLAARINEDIKEAMRSRDTARLSALRMFKSSLKYAALEKGAGGENELSDEDVIAVARKRIKQCRDAAEGFDKGGRSEQADVERAEIALLEGYLPAAMSGEELAALVKQTIAEIGATGKAQTGAVMKAVMQKAAGRTDGRSVNAEVQKQLG